MKLSTARLSLVVLTCLTMVAPAEGVRSWTDYRVILWTSGNVDKHRAQWPLIAQRLGEMGVNTGMGHRDEAPRDWIDSGFGYYVENIINKGLCLKFSSSVTDWSKFIDGWMQERSPKSFVRDYSFDDPEWLGWARKVMGDTASRHAPFAPLAYDIRDELSSTISANPFDYDFSPTALAGFRAWLKTQYADLAALNAQWETDFADWDSVMPFSTDQIKARMVTGEQMPKGQPDWSRLKQVKFDPMQAQKELTRWNFSPWCDHRTYMDISLARTLDALRQAAHEKDPATPVGIEGAQMPHAFGGYDLWRLSQALDWIEPYDVCNSREILGSFMPGKTFLSTVFEKETNPAMRRLWHLLLLGDKGCIIWWSEDVIDWSKPDLPLTAKGLALAPVLREMTSPLARLFLLAEREYDPIAIHYSQTSIQVAWLLESTADGKTWPRRFSSFEATHNQHAQVRNGMLKAFQDLGFYPQFLCDDQIVSGAAKARQIRALCFPRSDLSEPAASRIDRDLRDDNRPRPSELLYISQGSWTQFDAHGRLITAPSDFKIPPVATVLSMNRNDKPSGKELPHSFQDYPAARASKDGDVDFLNALGTELTTRNLKPVIKISPLTARVLAHRYRLGNARLLAFERNIDYKMSEDLKQAGGNEALETPVTFEAEWDEPGDVYELRSGRHLGRLARLKVDLDPWTPALYALLPAPVDGDVIQSLLRESGP